MPVLTIDGWRILRWALNFSFVLVRKLCELDEWFSVVVLECVSSHLQCGIATCPVGDGFFTEVAVV